MSYMSKIWDNWRFSQGTCADCTGCESPHPLYGTGSESADIVIAAMEPTYKLEPDNVTGQARQLDWQQAKVLLYSDRVDCDFPLWELHREFAEEFDIDVKDIYFTNVNKCNVGDTEETLQYCRDYIVDEIESVNPQVVTMWGKTATETILEEYGESFDGSIVKDRGKVWKINGRAYVAYPHWGYIMQYADESIESFWSYVRRRTREVYGQGQNNTRLTDF